MCRHATARLEPDTRAAADARRFLRATLEAWQLSALAEVAQLALSELVTNAVLHAGTQLQVTVACAEGHLEVAVSDADPTPPSLRPHRGDLRADLDALLAVEAGLHDAVDERDPRLDVGDAGSVAGGRGLLLVDALVPRWGISPLPDGGGKAVWTRAPVPQGWGPRPCRCPDTPGASLLPSGGPAVHAV